MLSLTIDTSSSIGSMAIGNKDKIIAKTEWSKDKSHSEKVTGAMEALLKKAGVQSKDLQLLICGRGPGSFTGLRVGLSVVKTLAYSLNIPIIAIDDCFALGINTLATKTEEPVLTVIDAQKNKVFAAIYQSKNGKLQTLLSPSLLSWEEVEEKITAKSYICVGDGYSAHSPFLSPPLLKKLKRKTEIADEPRAEMMFEYVYKNPADFENIIWSQLSALYIRASAAEEVLAQKTGKDA